MTPSTNVKNELNPLFEMGYPNSSFSHYRTRMLTDRGIIKLLQSPFIKLNPPILNDELYTRVQPTSIDLRVSHIESIEDIFKCSIDWPSKSKPIIIPPDNIAELSLQDNIASLVIESMTTNHSHGTLPYHCIHFKTVARSSMVRNGPFDSLGTLILSTDGNSLCLTIKNISPNSIKFEPGERIGQVFIEPQIFFDHYLQSWDIGGKPINTPEGDFIRSLDMGVEIRTEETLRYLAKEGYFSLLNKTNSDFEIKEGAIVLHASSKAKRMRKLDFTLEFKNRKEYEESGILYEDIDISNGYTIQKREMIVIDAQESLKLSKHIGMQLYGRIGLPNLTWADPGYNGIMAGFPKLPGVTIRPGDPIGLLRVFYYPKGVETPYGDKKRNSQYQGQKTFQVGARE